jgi:hypothetical protein
VILVELSGKLILTCHILNNIIEYNGDSVLTKICLFVRVQHVYVVKMRCYINIMIGVTV